MKEGKCESVEAEEGGRKRVYRVVKWVEGWGWGGSSSDYIVHQATGWPASAHRIDV